MCFSLKYQHKSCDFDATVMIYEQPIVRVSSASELNTAHIQPCGTHHFFL